MLNTLRSTEDYDRQSKYLLMISSLKLMRFADIMKIKLFSNIKYKYNI